MWFFEYSYQVFSLRIVFQNKLSMKNIKCMWFFDYSYQVFSLLINFQ